MFLLTWLMVSGLNSVMLKYGVVYSKKYSSNGVIVVGPNLMKSKPSFARTLLRLSPTVFVTKLITPVTIGLKRLTTVLKIPGFTSPTVELIILSI